MAATGIASSILAKTKHSTLADPQDEEEPMSRQLEILMERRRQEEVRKARHHWSLLRNSIRNTVQAVQEADIKSVVISHGIHHLRKLNHETRLKQVMYIKELNEYLTSDGQCVRFFLADGRKKKTYTPEEPMDHISYCSLIQQYVGWSTDGDELFLMNSDFEIISQSRAPSTIIMADYNKNTNEYITVGPGFFVTWAFRYGARHLIPRKMNRTDFKENNMFTHMVLEATASRSQKLFLSVDNAVAVYNVFEGNQLAYRKNLHEREITALTFFNPLKYLVTGALDGTIKIWDSHWHVKMVFVGHTGTVNALDIYPHGTAIISASYDKTIRVWNLDTCDEVDRAIIEEPLDNLQTTLDYDVFFTYAGKKVNMWKIQHLYQILTSVGQRIVKIKHTNHPNFSVRSVVMSRDCSVRIISPVTGDVITTLLLNPSRGLVDVAYAIEEETMFTVMSNGDILKVKTNRNPCQIIKHWKCPNPDKDACNYLLVYEYVVEIGLKTDTWDAIKRSVATKSIKATVEGENGEEGDGDGEKKKTNCNRTLLLGGRRDGYICVFNWNTGEVDFKIDAHGSKGVMSMIANSKVDQLISAGKDNVIKVWRVYPFVQEALAPLMSFFCAHLPLHMTMIKTHLCVAFQDHATATYSIVMYNLRDRNRFDHEPGDDHSEAITGLSACPRLKLYASASLDGTIRIWNDSNMLVRLLKLKSVPHSVGFCNQKADLLVGIGNHLYKIPHYVYLPKSYMFRMVSLRFTEQKAEGPLPEDRDITQKLSKNDISRLKNSHSSFKYTNYIDILTKEEEEEITREKNLKDDAFSRLAKREYELAQIRDGDITSAKKPKSTNFTKSVAFKNYMKMYYDKPKPTIPKDDPYPEDTVKQKIKEPEEPVEEKWEPEREPTGFFPPASSVSRAPSTQVAGTPLEAAYAPVPQGFIPNSVLTKILWPQSAKDELAKKRKAAEWKLPTFTTDQLDQITQLKQARDEAERREKGLVQADLERWPSLDSWRVKSRSTRATSRSEHTKSRSLHTSLSKPYSAHSDDRHSADHAKASSRWMHLKRRIPVEIVKADLQEPQVDTEAQSKIIEQLNKEDDDKKQVTFVEEGDDITGRVMEMDWGDDEEEKQAAATTPRDIWDDDRPLKREKSKLSDADAPKSAIKNKFADIMAKPPTPPASPKEEEAETPVPSENRFERELTEKSLVSQVSSKQLSDLEQRPPSTPRQVKPTKPITKLISKAPAPPSPPKAKTPEPLRTPPKTKLGPPPQKESARARTPTPPPPRPITPLPGFITQFKGVDWFDKFFPNCNESTFPKPWSLENFITALVRLIKVADYNYKVAILEAILMMHAQEEFVDSIAHGICKAVAGVLNHHKDPPTCMMEDQRNFIVTAIKTLHQMGTHDKDFVTELLVQFLDGDKEVRGTIQSVLMSCGLQDPHKYLPKELDSWDIWNVEEDDRKADLRRMCQQWLDRWMTSYKLHLEDAIERMKKGQNLHGRLQRDQLKKRGTPPPGKGGKGILRRSIAIGTGDPIHEDQETITTLEGVEHIARPKGVTVTFDHPPDPALIDSATYIDAMNYFCDMMMEKELEAMKAPGKRVPGSKENVVQAKNTVLVLPKIPHKPALVRLGETHTSTCRPHRETNLHIDYRLPPMTARGYNPIPGQINGFVNSINLPLKPLYLNPFPNVLDAMDARFQEPILITLKSSQKYFIPSQSVVAQEAVAAAL